MSAGKNEEGSTGKGRELTVLYGRMKKERGLGTDEREGSTGKGRELSVLYG